MAIDYTNYDYQALKDRITELYKDSKGMGEGYEGSTGQTLIQLLADTTDSLHYMLERRSQESFTSSARLDSSVWMAASGVGYVPRRSVSARGVLELELRDSDGNVDYAEYEVRIPYGTKVTFDGENFIVAEDAVIKEGDSKTTIMVMEGVKRTDSFNFSESPYKDSGFLEIPEYQDIEEFSLRVVDGQGDEYVFVDEVDNNGFRAGSLSFAPEGYRGYDIRFTREAMRLVFGDGKFGKKPSGLIHVSWIESKGSDVDIIQTGLNFEFETDTITDTRPSIPKRQYFYSLKNSTPVDGGTMPETMEEIRDNIAAFVRSNDRAVTNADYEFRVRKSGIGGIRDVAVFGEEENGSIIFTMNNVYVAYAKDNKTPLNASQKKDLADYLSRYKVNTTHVVFKNAIETPIRLNIDFRRNSNLPISNQQLYNELLDRVDEYFSIRPGVIGKPFQYSEFLSYLQKLKMTFGGVTYDMTDYVYISVGAFFPFTVPTPSYDGVIELSYEYPVNAGDVWSVVVNGQTFSVNVTGSDTVDTLVSKMKNELFAGTPFIVGTEKPNQIRITHPENKGTFTVSVVAGDIIDYVLWKQFLKLPQSVSGGVTRTEPQVVAGSVVIKDKNDVPLMSDEAVNGRFTSLTGYFFPEAIIDYNKAFIEIPTLPNGTYFVEYQQNDFKNFEVALDGYVSYRPFPSWDQLNDPSFNDRTMSSINLLDR